MKVDKIARLFAAQPEPALVSPPQSESVDSKLPSEAGAVRLSSSMQEPGSANAAGSSARSARVAQLKEQVANGSYNPDPQRVASAVLQDLFA